MLFLKQSTASQTVLIGPFVDSTDGVTAETGLTIANTDIRLSKNGANITSKNSGGGTHDENGWYQITLDATDTNTVGKLQLHCVMSGALPVWHEYYVLEENVYDAWFGASAAAGTDLASILTDTGTTLQAELDGIQADTEDIQSRLPAALVGGRIDATVDGTGMESGAISAIADGVLDEALSGHTTAGTLGKAVADIETDATAILADTNELQTDDIPTLIAALPTAAENRAEMDSNSTQLAAIVADTNELQSDDYPTTLAAIEADTQDIQSRLPAALVSGRMSSDVVALSGSTTAADNLEASALGIIVGQAQTGTLSTTQMTTNLSGYDNDRLIGRVVVFTGSPLAGEVTDITDYASASGLVTFSTLTEAPTNGTTFVVI